MKPRPPNTLLLSPSNSFVPNSSAHFFFSLSLSLTSSTNYLSSRDMCTKAICDARKVSHEAPAERVVHTFFPPDYPTREGVSRHVPNTFPDIRFDGATRSCYTGRYCGPILALFRYTHYEALTGPVHHHPPKRL